MGEQRQIRSCSWNRMTTKRCTANGVTNEFILVDDDEVIILDFPETSMSKASGTSRTGNDSVLHRVISIDDDDDDDVHKAGSNSLVRKSAQVDNDDCQFIHEKCADFRFSKRQQQNSSSGIRFGLGSESESDYSDSDCSDCEIFESSDREVREQWEKAFSKKMKKAGKAVLNEEAGSSNPNCNAQFRPGLKTRTEQDGQTASKVPIHQKEVEQQPDTMKVRCETSKSSKENQKKKAACKTSDGDVVTKSVLGTQSNGARSKHGTSKLGESGKPIIDSIPSTSGQMHGLHGTSPGIDIMLNREMLKKTDDYKKAQEEEWESRQRQLQLQAEEVQRQRKRIKLANTRQVEMERRQKERVEEVRDAQKKDEESMDMKEKVRAEITKSLKLLELKSFNMASLLRGLGITVGGGTSPLPSEVHTAYKRAVLKFHPDRASRLDIRQQVEAEEKFKLIARMKDKFLL